MTKVELELRKLMNKYDDRYDKLERERQEAKREESVEDELTIEAMQRQCRIMIAELFQTMKALNVLDDEEVEYGGIKDLDLT